MRLHRNRVTDLAFWQSCNRKRHALLPMSVSAEKYYSSAVANELHILFFGWSWNPMKDDKPFQCRAEITTNRKPLLDDAQRPLFFFFYSAEMPCKWGPDTSQHKFCFRDLVDLVHKILIFWFRRELTFSKSHSRHRTPKWNIAKGQDWNFPDACVCVRWSRVLPGCAAKATWHHRATGNESSSFASTSLSDTSMSVWMNGQSDSKKPVTSSCPPLPV